MCHHAVPWHRVLPAPTSQPPNVASPPRAGLRALAHRLGVTDTTVALVVFTADDKMLRCLDAATGPCLPTTGRPMASPGRQRYGDTFDEVESLFTTLTDQPPQAAFVRRTRTGDAELRRLSTAFASSLAALADASDYEGQMKLVLPVAARWQGSRRWPRGMELGGLALRVHEWAVTLADGLARGRDGYCWRGPSVPEYEVAAVK